MMDKILILSRSINIEAGAFYGKRAVECIDGARACPPEDCGGVWGYEEMLQVLKDPKHEEYESTLEWLGEDFDPEAFDMEATNKALRQF